MQTIFQINKNNGKALTVAEMEAMAEEFAKEQDRQAKERLNELFSQAELNQLFLLPQAIGELMWHYLHLAREAARAMRATEYKTLSRKLVALDEEYIHLNPFVPSPQARHICRLVADNYLDQYGWDMKKLQFAVDGALKKYYPEIDEYSVKSNGTMAVLMWHAYADAVLRTDITLGEALNVKKTKGTYALVMNDLKSIAKQYAGDLTRFDYTQDQNIRLGMKVIYNRFVQMNWVELGAEKALAKIEVA